MEYVIKFLEHASSNLLIRACKTVQGQISSRINRPKLRSGTFYVLLCYNISMGWDNDDFFYTTGLLKTIAAYYQEIYNGIPRLSGELTNPWELAELKADFDLALNSLGKGTWNGKREYRGFGLFQRMVIADIFQDNLSGRDIQRARGIAYSRMRRFLNGG